MKVITGDGDQVMRFGAREGMITNQRVMLEHRQQAAAGTADTGLLLVKVKKRRGALLGMLNLTVFRQ